MMWHGFYGGGWPMFAGGILFWGSLLVLIAWGIRRSTQSQNDSTRPSNMLPLDILNRRYARGEITKEQYQDIKQDIKQDLTE